MSRLWIIRGLLSSTEGAALGEPGNRVSSVRRPSPTRLGAELPDCPQISHHPKKDIQFGRISIKWCRGISLALRVGCGKKETGKDARVGVVCNAGTGMLGCQRPVHRRYSGRNLPDSTVKTDTATPSSPSDIQPVPQIHISPGQFHRLSSHPSRRQGP